MESFTTDQYQQTYNAYDSDIAVMYVYFGQPTTTEYIRVVSLSWVGFLAQAGGLIGACLGFSFISLVEIVYWFIIRFCRLSKQEKRMEELARKQSVMSNGTNNNAEPNGSFDQIWNEGWDQPDIKKEDDWNVGLCQMEYQEDANIDNGNGSFLSRASSMCSIKVRHQLTVLRMFFGKYSNDSNVLN